MTWLALSLYALGVIGAAAAVGRDVPADLREWVIIAIWPVAVAWAVATVPFKARR
jgi:hypothetical protein